MENKSIKNYSTPSETAQFTLQSAINKVRISPLRQLILAILAGAFIAFAAEGSNMAAYNLFANPDTYGQGKALAGALFATGLALVIIAGGELFTGNTMMTLALFERKITLIQMLKNWTIVYIGNFIGSLFIVYMIIQSGLLNSSGGLLGGVTIKIAVYKTNLEFGQAFYLGLMANWLVTLGVWLAYGAKDVAGKILGIFFPIWLFVTSGFEHSIANMYYIPAGILAKSNETWAKASHLTSKQLAQLDWGTFIVNNLIPVTLGNIVGGSILVAGVYWFVYVYKKQ